MTEQTGRGRAAGAEPSFVEPLHRLHTYCARFPSEIAEAAIDELTTRGESVCDPFCGSGTSLVAGLVRKRRVIGSDIDVLAGMLSQIKCSPLSPDRYKSWRSGFVARLEQLFDEVDRGWPPRSLPKPGKALVIGSLELDVPPFPQLRYWFPPRLVGFLAAIAHAASDCRQGHYEQVALISLSAAIIAKWPNTLSYAMDIDHTRPHRRVQRFSRPRVMDTYLKRLGRTIECLGALYRTYQHAGVLNSLTDAARIVCPHDAREPLPEVGPGTQALVVTSPPYFNAVDYPRAHRLSVCWMNGHAPAELASRRDYLGLRHLGDFNANDWFRERKTVRRLIPKGLRDTEHARRLGAFFADLESVLGQSWRVLRPDGHGVFVIADNTIREHRVKSHEVLLELAKAKGFVEVHHRLRSIASLRRRFPVGTFGFDGPMTHEHVLVLRKPKRCARA